MYAKQTIQIECNVKHALELHEEADGCPPIQLILPIKKMAQTLFHPVSCV